MRKFYAGRPLFVFGRLSYRRALAACGGLCGLLLPTLAGGAGQNDNAPVKHQFKIEVHPRLSGWSGGQDAPVTLQLKFKPGDVSKYQMSMQMEMSLAGQPPTPMTMKMDQERRVQKVLPNGDAVVASTTSTQTKLSGQPLPGQKNATMTMTLSPSGKIVSMSGAPPAAGGIMSINSTFANGSVSPVLFPNHPVKPGDSWDSIVTRPGVASGSYTLHCTFVKTEPVGQYRTARIHMTSTVPMNLMMNKQGAQVTQAASAAMLMSGTMGMAGDTNFAIAEGKIIRTVMNSAATIAIKPVPAPKGAGGASAKGAPGAAPPMNVKMKMTMAMTLVQ